jgi:hypothetical protein
MARGNCRWAPRASNPMPRNVDPEQRGPDQGGRNSADNGGQADANRLVDAARRAAATDGSSGGRVPPDCLRGQRTDAAFGDGVTRPSGSGDVSPHAMTSAARADDHHGADHVEIEPVINTSTPESAIPAPTRPNPQPTRWSACRRWDSIALTADMQRQNRCVDEGTDTRAHGQPGRSLSDNRQ